MTAAEHIARWSGIIGAVIFYLIMIMAKRTLNTKTQAAFFPFMLLAWAVKLYWEFRAIFS